MAVSLTSHLWVLIHKHQGEIQALGPSATLGAAIIAAGVAGTFGWLQYRIGRDQRHIAASQRDIAKMRARMDLHAKRYEILQSVYNVMNLARGRDHAANEEQFQQQRRIMHQCSFFFPSDVEVMVDEIDDCATKACSYGRLSNPSEHVIAKQQEANDRLNQLADRSRTLFLEVMRFKDVE